MTIKNLEKMDSYNPTNYVNNSEPDIDADNLNKTENKLEETVAKANEIIDALKTLISTVQTNSDNTVPSSSLAYAMQQEITKNKEDIATANSNLEMESGAATINADWATGSANYYKIGKQCVVNALVTLKQDTTVNNTLLISGLPISAQEKVCLIHGTTGYGVFKVNANTGNITIDSGAKGNSIFYFEMIYPTK